MDAEKGKQIPEPDALAVADRLHSAAIHLLRQVRTRDTKSGVGPAQLSALSVLVFAGPRSLGELAAAEQVRPPTMSRIVAGLMRAGLVRGHVTKKDRRRLRLEPTVKGTELLWAARKRRVESLAATLRQLPADQVEQLRQAAELINQLSRGV
ncbi:MAG TPA: MarR family transcriptional regulator [Terriglobales bacterium]|nr:MarR family transcriptional regulator [Terriglobales bacterium]